MDIKFSIFVIIFTFIPLNNGLPTQVPILIPKDPILQEDQLVFDEGNLDAIVVEANDATTTPPEINSFDDVIEFNADDCFLPKSKGPCRAVIDQYFFNTATKSCELFAWSGCGGNKNRFRSKENCESQCSSPAKASKMSSEPVPLSPVGTNEKPMSKHKIPSCPKFGGCGERCVIIQDRSDRGCKKCLCGIESVDSVSASATPGPLIVSSGMNVTITKNTEVSIGSVSGVPKDVEEDAPILGNPAENCKLSAKRGHCRGMMTRFHYDPSIKDCVEFHYGGCDGNSNNFVTKAKCNEYCKGQ